MHEGKGDLVVLWLDLASAYGSIPQKLVLLVIMLEGQLFLHFQLSNSPAGFVPK